MATEKTTLQVEVKTQGVNQSTQKLNAFEKASKKATNAAEKIGAASKTTGNRLLDGIGNSVNKVSNFLSGNGTSALSKFAGRLGQLGKAIGGVKALFIAMIAVKVAQFFYRAAEAAAKFGGELANIASLLPGQISKVQSYGEAINTLSIELAKSQNDLAQATYQVVSAFGDQANTMETVEIAAKAATAGLASTSDAVNLLAAVSKGYNDTSTETLQRISDLAFTTVRLGQTTFPELAASMGQVVPIAESLGVSMEELFGITATLTGVTGNTSEVMTQTRAAMVALLRPLPELENLYKKLNVSGGKEFIESQGGVVQALQFVQAESEATGRSITDYIGRVEGITATLALSGAQSENYVQKMEEIQKQTLSTDTALSEVTNGINKYGFGLQQFRQRLVNLREALGGLALVFTADLNRAPGKFITLLDQAVRTITSYVRALETITRPIRRVFSFLFELLFDLIRGPLKLLQGAFNWIANFLNAVFTRASDVFLSKVREIWESMTGVREIIASVTEWFQNLQGRLDPTALGIALVDTVVKALSVSLIGLAVGLQTIVVDVQNTIIAFRGFGEIIQAIINKDFSAIKDIAVSAFSDIKDNLQDLSAQSRLAFGVMGDVFKEETDAMVEQARQSFELINYYMNNTIEFRTDFASEDLKKQFESTLEFINERAGVIGGAFDAQAERVKAFGDTLEAMLDSSEVENYSINQFIQENIDLFNQWKGIIEETGKTAQEILGDKFVGALDKSNTQTEELLMTFANFGDMVSYFSSELFKSIGLSDELSGSLGQLAGSFAVAGTEQAIEGFKELGQAFKDGSISAEEFSQIIANQFKAILDALPMLFLQAGLQAIAQGNTGLGLGLIGAAAGSAFVSGFTDSQIEGNAKGAAYSNGTKITAYGNGGVASAPTYFNTNSGPAVAGEQGEEAILPLARTASGDLGVYASGSANIEIPVTIINETSAKVEQKEVETSNGKELYFLITQNAKAGFANGEYDDIMTGRYNTTRRGNG